MKLWRLVCGACLVAGACGGTSAPVTADAAPHGPVPLVADAAPARVDAAANPTARADAAGPEAQSAAATWSAIYAQLLVNASYPSNCMGSGCHDPGVEKGIDLSSRENGWSSIQKRLTPGAPGSSELITDLKSGYMPQDKPQMPAADVARISAWVQAGAQDD
ncbi:MAG TPA: hypothetical protein VKZ18_22590 [Polyangia bacterium]|nr:hypothetical protein [Polyangia bacterium]